MEDTKSILIVVTSYARIDAQHPTGLWFEEFAVPYESFAEAGYLATVASIKGGKVPIDPRSLPEDQAAIAVKGPLAALQHTQRLMEVDVSEFDAVFFPGGHGTMFDFPLSREVAGRGRMSRPRRLDASQISRRQCSGEGPQTHRFQQ